MNLEKHRHSLTRLRTKYQRLLAEIEELNRNAYWGLGIWKKKHLYTDRVEAIEQALQTLEQGQYGICVTCNKPISKQRLEAMPYTTRCFECELTKNNGN